MAEGVPLTLTCDQSFWSERINKELKSAALLEKKIYIRVCCPTSPSCGISQTDVPSLAAQSLQPPSQPTTAIWKSPVPPTYMARVNKCLESPEARHCIKAVSG